MGSGTVACDSTRETTGPSTISWTAPAGLTAAETLVRHLHGANPVLWWLVKTLRARSIDGIAGGGLAVGAGPAAGWRRHVPFRQRQLFLQRLAVRAGHAELEVRAPPRERPFAAIPLLIEPPGWHRRTLVGFSLAGAAMTLYLMATTFSLMLSTHGALWAFGVLALLSFGVAYAAYATWFISVWCYFAALLGCVVLLHFRVRSVLPRPARA